MVKGLGSCQEKSWPFARKQWGAMERYWGGGRGRVESAFCLWSYFG